MELDIFIEGETIDLRIPTLEFAEKSDWYKWFNNKKITKYLYHGIFPNTKEKQCSFFREQKNRLSLMISTKNGQIIGTASLSDIDFRTCSANISLILINSSKDNRLASLETISLLTEHAFLQMGLKRISAGQHIDLAQWSHRMSLLGYRLEGIEKDAFIKGAERADVIKIACRYEDYQRIVLDRGGTLWDSQEKMLQRVKQLPKISIHKKLQEFFKENESYYNNIFSLGGGGQWRGVA